MRRLVRPGAAHESTTMSNAEEVYETHLPVGLSRSAELNARGTENEMVAARLTAPCPVVGEQVLLQRCAFCPRSEGLFLDPMDGSLNLRCRLPAESGPPDPAGAITCGLPRD